MTSELETSEHRIIYSENSRGEISLDEVYTPKRRGDIGAYRLNQADKRLFTVERR